MSNVRVLFFASLRDSVGRDMLSLEAASTSELWRALEERLDAVAMQVLRGENIRLAVNHNLIEGDVNLSDGDEVAFLPPVTGG